MKKRLKATNIFEKTVASRIKTHVEQGQLFTLRTIAEECGLDFDNRRDYAKIYGVIARWREKALDAFDNVDVKTMLADGKGMEEVWDTFLYMINARGIYLLFALGEDKHKGEYVQPTWIEKEITDFIRWKHQLHGQFKVLAEMIKYGESFPTALGITKTPKEIAQGMAGVLDNGQVKLEEKVKRSIEALTPPKEPED